MFLLKGHEDLRQDERVMQLFGLVNTLLLNDPDTFRRNLTIQVSIIHDYFMHYSTRVLYFSLNQPSFVVFFCGIISVLVLQACHTCSVLDFTIGYNLCTLCLSDSYVVMQLFEYRDLFCVCKNCSQRPKPWISHRQTGVLTSDYGE